VQTPLRGGDQQLAVGVVDASAIDSRADGLEFVDACQNTVSLIVVDLRVGQDQDHRTGGASGAFL
jgi:hypothetical protein